MVILLPFLLCLLNIAFAYADDGEKPRSLALKDLSPERSPIHIPRDNSSEELWDAFMMMEKANAGDPVAEHDLGLHYLLGKDFSLDTAKAAYWIGKAAAQNFLPAVYNYGLCLNNGWGVPWNPFEGFLRFGYAARHGLIEAEYIYGLLYTDNLIIPRNYDTAYKWIKMAADSSFVPAVEVLKEFKRRGIKLAEKSSGSETSPADTDTTTKNPLQLKPALQPIFLDLSTDTVQKADNKTLLKEALAEGTNRLKSLTDTTDDQNVDSVMRAAGIRIFSDAADSGSPEALTMMGRFYEEGLGIRKDPIKASAYYLRAVRLESRWSPLFVWEMTRNEDYFKRLKEQVDAGNPEAEFVWAALIEGGFDNHLTDAQALALLQDAAKQNYPDALIQMGICYTSGRWVHPDPGKAASAFNRARLLGNLEARIRLIAVELKMKHKPEDTNFITHLTDYASNGSILAEEVLAYCYQSGDYVPASMAQAVRFYRHAAERGSRLAYTALKEMYDEIRPNDPQFQF